MTKPIQIELPTGLPVGTVNAYLFIEPEPVLLDTGVKTEACFAALESALAEHGLRLVDLVRVIISHPHIDHCGLAGTIAAHSQATFHIYEPAQPWLTHYRRMWQKRNDYYSRRLFVYWDLPAEISEPVLGYYRRIEEAVDDVPTARIKPVQAGEHLALGGLPWQVLHTPGHDSMLTCFYQPDTAQFLSTDMLLPLTPTPIPDLPTDESQSRLPSLPQYLDSLAVVEALECEIVYPGHGEPFTHHRVLIQKQRQRLEKRKGEALSLIQGGVTTLGELLLALYPHYPPEYRFAGLWMALGYVDLLAAEKRIDLIERERAGVTVVSFQPGRGDH